MSSARSAAYSLLMSSATGNLVERHVGVETGAVLVGDLLGLDEQMPEIRIVAPHGGEVDTAPRRLRICSAAMPWPLGGSSQTVVTPIGRGHGLDPLAGVLGEILQGEEAADLLGVGDEGLGGLAAVEGVAAAIGDPLEGVGQRRVGEELTLGGNLPPGMKTSAKPGISLNFAAPLAQAAAMTRGTGAPSRAASMVGSSSRDMGSLPNFPCSSNQPSTHPGTVHE